MTSAMSTEVMAAAERRMESTAGDVSALAVESITRDRLSPLQAGEGRG